MSSNAAFYKISIDTIIYDQGGSIGLVISSIFLINSIVEYYVEPELNYASNHQKTCTPIEYGRDCKNQKLDGKLRLDQMKEKEFMLCLEKQNNLVKKTLAKAR